jgi:hypothetical protein
VNPDIARSGMSKCCTTAIRPESTPQRPVTTGGFREANLDLPLRRVACFLELLPLWRALQCLVVLLERLFSLALLHQHVEVPGA